jgi:hypothetical protein
MSPEPPLNFNSARDNSGVSVIGMCVPVRRALHVDPAWALRQE